MISWLFGSSTRPPVLLRTRSSKAFIIVTVATAIFTDVFLYAVIVPVLPYALTSRAYIESSSVQTWISILLAVYGGALLVISPFCGWVTDRLESRRWPMLIGLVALLGSTVLLCFGRSIGIIATGRILQGFSASVVWVVGFALLVDTVGPEGIGGAMGYVGLAMSAAPLLAPMLGGLVFVRVGYYAVFAMAFGLISLDIVLRVLLVEKKLALKWASPTLRAETMVDPAALVAAYPPTLTKIKEVVVGKKEFVHVTTEVSIEEVSTMPVDEVTPHGISSKPAKISTRLPPVISLLASRRLLSALWCCAIVSMLYAALDSTLALFVKTTFHWNSFGAGLIFLPIFIACLLGPIIGKLSDKHGPRWLAASGMVLGSPCFILLRLVQHDTIQHKILLCTLLAIIGASLTLTITPIMAEVTYAVEAKTNRRPPGFFGKNGAYAQGYSLFNMAWAAGSMIGPLLGGLTTGSGGWPTSTLILGCIAGFTTAPAVIWTGGSIFKRMKSKRDGSAVA